MDKHVHKHFFLHKTNITKFLPRIGNGLVWTVSVDGNILFEAVGDIALALELVSSVVGKFFFLLSFYILFFSGVRAQCALIFDFSLVIYSKSQIYCSVFEEFLFWNVLLCCFFLN